MNFGGSGSFGQTKNRLADLVSQRSGSKSEGKKAPLKNFKAKM